jgi:hypothetical protein
MDSFNSKIAPCSLWYLVENTHSFSVFRGLSSDAFDIGLNVSSLGTITNVQQSWKDLKRNVLGLTEIMSHNLLEATEKKYTNKNWGQPVTSPRFEPVERQTTQWSAKEPEILPLVPTLLLNK